MSELTKIPYVGKATAASLNLIGYDDSFFKRR